MLTSPALNAALGRIEHGRVKTDDGVELAYQSFGSGPPVVFANGIGVRYPGAVRQVEALRRQYRVICWDYRGMGQSVMPADAEVSMARQGRDLLAVLDRLALDDALLVGWSMGVQVALEVIRAAPQRVNGFVALLGCAGRPFEGAFPTPVARLTESLFGLVGKHPLLGQAPLDLAVAIPGVAALVLSRLTFVGANVDRDVFDANVRSVAGIDKRLYARTMLAMASHDAFDLLPALSCPALIIAGERDTLTPPRVAKQMVAAIPGASYREVAGGTHFALIEQPALVNGWLSEFAAQVYGAAPKEPRT